MGSGIQCVVVGVLLFLSGFFAAVLVARMICRENETLRAERDKAIWDMERHRP